MSDVKPDVILEFRTWAVALGNSKVTVDNNLIVLRSFFSWAEASNIVRTNPVSQSRHAKQVFFGARSEKRQTYTKEEYARLLECSAGSLSIVIRLLANLGLRISEPAMLEWSDVDFDGGWVHIRVKQTHDGIDYSPKDKSDRKVPMNGQVRGYPHRAPHR